MKIIANLLSFLSFTFSLVNPSFSQSITSLPSSQFRAEGEAQFVKVKNAELLTLASSSGIMLSGSGTKTLTLVNADPTTKPNSKTALAAIRYKNTSASNKSPLVIVFKELDNKELTASVTPIATNPRDDTSPPVFQNSTETASSIAHTTFTLNTAVNEAGGLYYLLAPPAPEINLKGNGVDIVNGASIPSASNSTEFGNQNVASGSILRTFTVENIGTSILNLNVSNPRVTITGHTGDFTVDAQPSSSTISIAGNLTFQIKFEPTASGLREATISIANDDSDENPYTFGIQGTGTCDEGSTPSTSILGAVNLNCAITSVTRTASGGSSYSWSSSLGTNAVASITSSGTYTVTVTGANSCTATATTEVTQDITPPSVSITGTDSLTCAITSVTRTASGGLHYFWSKTLGSNATASITSAGTYTVTVTGANSCIATATTIVVRRNFTGPTESITGTDSLSCFVSSVKRTASGAATYSWSDGLGTSPLVNITAAGIYTVTTTSAGGCTSTATTKVIFKNDLASLSASNDGPYNERDDINLAAMGGTSYTWAGPNGFISKLTDPSIHNGKPANAGIYTVTVQTGTCTATATTEVSITCGDPGMTYFLAYSGINPEIIAQLVPGLEVQYSTRPMTVIAVTNCQLPVIESVKFQLSGTTNSQYYVDNNMPFAAHEINGTPSGDVLLWNSYTFIARGYEQDNAEGSMLVGPDVIQFNIVGGDGAISQPILSNNSLCAGSNLTVSANQTGTFDIENVFHAYLSDSSGSFTNPILIGTSADPDRINCTTPNYLQNSDNYSVMIRSSSPVVSSLLNTASFSITVDILDLLPKFNDIDNLTKVERAALVLIAKNKIYGNAKVKFVAGNSVLLEPGFKADAGTTFEAVVEDVCL
ncbi:MAG: hypothetical protein ACI9IP_000091 [Arcticibacterium sp.]|jgi:hypothetical protein